MTPYAPARPRTVEAARVRSFARRQPSARTTFSVTLPPTDSGANSGTIAKRTRFAPREPLTVALERAKSARIGRITGSDQSPKNVVV